MPKDPEYVLEILERIRLAAQLDNHLSSDQLENILNGIKKQFEASLEQLKKRIRFWRLAGCLLFIVALVVGILLTYLLLIWPVPCPLPTIIIYAPHSTSVLPGESIAIFSESKPEDAQVTWKATCGGGQDCSALAYETGDDNFLIAPTTPVTTVTVSAKVKDKCGYEDSASLIFQVADNN
jgi:hypothetical protein